MATDIELGARTLGEVIAVNQPSQAGIPAQRACDGATDERMRTPRKDKSVLEQFLQSFIPALGAWQA